MNGKILIVVGVGLVAATASKMFFYSIGGGFRLEDAKKTAAVVVAARDLTRGYQLLAADLRVE